MNLLQYKTMSEEVIKKIENINNKTYLCIYIDKNSPIKFEVEYVWDMLVEQLSIAESNDSPGMERRIYEAKNVYRLTNEFLNNLKELENNNEQ